MLLYTACKPSHPTPPPAGWSWERKVHLNVNSISFVSFIWLFYSTQRVPLTKLHHWLDGCQSTNHDDPKPLPAQSPWTHFSITFPWCPKHIEKGGNSRALYFTNNRISLSLFSTLAPYGNRAKISTKPRWFDYVRWYTSRILITQFFFLSQHPYPSEDQKKQLAQDTGLTILQVNNW